MNRLDTFDGKSTTGKRSFFLTKTKTIYQLVALTTTQITFILLTLTKSIYQLVDQAISWIMIFFFTLLYEICKFVVQFITKTIFVFYKLIKSIIKFFLKAIIWIIIGIFKLLIWMVIFNFALLKTIFSNLFLAFRITKKIFLFKYRGITQKGRKILVIGAPGVGKTKLFHMINNTYREKQKDTSFWTNGLTQFPLAKVPFVDRAIQFILLQSICLIRTWKNSLTSLCKYIFSEKTFNMIQEKMQLKLQSLDDFQQIKLIPNYEFVDTPTADFDSSVEIREQNIVRFQKYLVKNGHLICKFLIVVNFERTDLMKQKISGVYKYFRKYDSYIGIIVTDFDLSEHPEEDKQQLIKTFNNAFKIPKESIVFINNSMSSQVVKKQILSAANIFSLNDTLFEIFSKEDEEREYREFTKKMEIMIPNANE